MKPQIISTRISDELLGKIDRMAWQMGLTRKEVVELSFREWLKDNLHAGNHSPARVLKF
ncbi:ribbon-helix-helix protein, CopG family [Geobacter sp. FeAm09]|uniref:ribbon-helix-helix protein, CopG family n=1 Tax=Geobacter sp. FeAm09 TaxID=2597769 RepID=UPI0011EFBC8D|nr:ribbon-helix-helix protein, CopG family [Geobacter sp. FeAm09]QEM67525.1 ribbon-helix-helix protein, CopG family [Geobacter sp. FeAm09]